MSMLAEPRQRKRYNLVPRGKALYEDDSRFGTKMLEKMGWSKGKGLGAKEDGTKDFVRVRYKNDIEGLGFEQRDDQWTQHENGFSSLLNSLNGNNSDKGQPSPESEDEAPRMGFGFQTNDNQQGRTTKDKKSKLKERISGVSLEEKSKQSKARVHYKKFTRGKDLSQYSEKDLANIFGVKADNNKEAENTDLSSQLDVQEEKPDNENFSGVQTISTGVSVSDYFKIKMAALKNRTAPVCGSSEVCESEQQPELDTTCKKKKKKDRTAEVLPILEQTNHLEKQQPEEESFIDESSCYMGSDNVKQKRKKRKHQECDDAKVELEEGKSVEQNEIVCDTHKKKKKAREPVHVDECVKISDKTSGNCIKSLSKTPTPIENDSKSINDEGNKMPNDENQEKETVPAVVGSEDENMTKSTVSSTQPEPHISNRKKRKAASISKEITDIGSVNDLQADLTPFNVYPISSFCAEKFRNLNLSYFPNSSLPQIEGYSLNKDIQLKIEINKTDEMRITRLWDNTLSKYSLVEKETRKAYHKYVKETYKAKKQKQKRPSLHFKSWKRKNAFAKI